MYLTYSEYYSYGGTLSETDFNNLSYEAEISINFYTFDRLINDTEFSENVKKCVYKLIDLYNTFNRYKEMVTNLTTPIINSHSNDGVSTTFGGYLGNTRPDDLNTVQKKLDSDIYKTIRQYLLNQRNQKGELLLYRGVRNVR